MAAKNQVFRNFIGQGYYGTITPPVIQRNILENPGWYTAYTPYQAEIAQGRMEMLLNFQTMVADLTGLDIANASLLDEATAAAEAMHMCYAVGNPAGEAPKRTRFFVSSQCLPQTIALVQTRAKPLGIKVVVGDHEKFSPTANFCGALVQYPAADGVIHDYAAFAEKVHAAGALFVVAADLLALTLIKPPGEFGADIAVGSAQRFGVPFGFGGPHAAYCATKDAYKRIMPGRLIGVSKDSHGNPALRLSLQTREQHIRRDKATSNICTAQVLLAVMAAAYACYHGPEGLKAIARRTNALARTFAAGLELLGRRVSSANYFDTVTIDVGARQANSFHRARHQAEDQSAPNRSRHGRPEFRRDDHRRRPQGSLGDFQRRRGDHARSARALRGGGFPGDREPPVGLSHASGFRHPSHGDPDAALFARAGGEGSLALPLDDPAGLVHDEAERDERDVSRDLAGDRRVCIRLRRTTSGRATARCSRSWKTGSPRSPDSPRFRCSRTPARRASTRACSSSGNITSVAARDTATSA